MIRRPPRSTLSSSSAASDVYKRQIFAFVHIMAAAFIGDPVHRSAAAALMAHYTRGPKHASAASALMSHCAVTGTRKIERDVCIVAPWLETPRKRARTVCDEQASTCFPASSTEASPSSRRQPRVLPRMAAKVDDGKCAHEWWASHGRGPRWIRDYVEERWGSRPGDPAYERLRHRVKRSVEALSLIHI